jgi:adenosine kinase
MQEIIITGSIAYDYLMRFPGSFREHILPDKLDSISLSFLVDEMTRQWGGAGANIAYTLALFGYRPRLMGTVGRDFADYRDWLESVGVQTGTVITIEELFTASFFANTDQRNDQIASFYGGAMNRARDFALHDVLNVTPDYVVISPNDPVAMNNLVRECRERKIPYMYDPSQQIPRLDAESLRLGVEGCHLLAVNKYEWGLLMHKTGLTEEEVLSHAKVLVRTLGKDGAEIFADGKRYFAPIYPTDGVPDPTGVGDAFRAGLVCGMESGLDWETTGRVASLCAAYVIEQVGTQNHKFNISQFVARYRQLWDDQGALDKLTARGAAAKGA